MILNVLTLNLNISSKARCYIVCCVTSGLLKRTSPLSAWVTSGLLHARATQTHVHTAHAHTLHIQVLLTRSMSWKPEVRRDVLFFLVTACSALVIAAAQTWRWTNAWLRSPFTVFSSSSQAVEDSSLQSHSGPFWSYPGWGAHNHVQLDIL